MTGGLFLRKIAGQLRASEMAAFAGGTLVYQAGRLALSLIAARVLGPEAFGDWVLVMLLVVYLNALGLGVTNGAGREIPFLAGAGRPREALRVAETATGASIISGSAAAVAVVALAPVLLEGRLEIQALLLAGGAAALQHSFLLEQVLFRSWFAFGRAAVQLTTLGIVNVVAGVGLLGYGIAGLLAAQMITFAVALALGIRLLPVIPRPRWSIDAARPLIAIGFPIMVAGLLYGLLTTIDRWLVATFLDRAAVGYYGLVGIVISGLLLVPQLLAQQFYPRMAFAHGEGRSRAELLSMARDQGLMAGVTVALLAVLVAVAAIIAIPIALPAYQSAVVPLGIALIGLVLYAVGSGYGNVLNTIGAHRRFLGIQTAALVANVVLAVALLSLGLGLVAVALASTVGMGLYSMMLHQTATTAAPAS